MGKNRGKITIVNEYGTQAYFQNRKQELIDHMCSGNECRLSDEILKVTRSLSYLHRWASLTLNFHTDLLNGSNNSSWMGLVKNTYKNWYN